MEFLTKLLKSKTMIVNVLFVAAGVLGYLSGDQVIAQHPELAAAFVSAAGVVNMILRFVTKLPLSAK